MDAESKPKICGTCAFWQPNRLKEPDPLARKWCLNPEVDAWTEDEHTCRRHLGADALEINVPAHTKRATLMDMRNQTPITEPVEVLIVTYSKDFPWLEYALKAFRKHCRGFQGVTVAHPNHEAALFAPLIGRFDVRLHGYDEVSGKGFLQHEVKMASADLFLPSPTKFVMHLDSDCIYKVETVIEDYFYNNKPVYLYRTYDSLIKEDPREPGARVISDCWQWKAPTETQLGFVTNAYTMTRHPTVFPIEFYAPYRAHIEGVHQRQFSEFMLDGRNEHPQTKMDFTAMGAWAFKFMHDKFHWINVETEEYPKDRQKCYHSHSGITPEVRVEIEAFSR